MSDSSLPSSVNEVKTYSKREIFNAAFEFAWQKTVPDHLKFGVVLKRRINFIRTLFFTVFAGGAGVLVGGVFLLRGDASTGDFGYWIMILAGAFVAALAIPACLFVTRKAAASPAMEEAIEVFTEAFLELYFALAYPGARISRIDLRPVATVKRASAF